MIRHTLTEAILETQIKEVKKIVHDNIDVNIDHYVSSFLQRRIQKRMFETKKETYSEYIDYLRDDFLEPLELNALLSVNVTEFFRNQNVWNVFEQKIIPEILKRSSDIYPIYIWSAGCAVGNEAYSLAMMFSNAIKTKKRFRVTANDINPTSIGIAKTGQYERKILENIPDSLVYKYLDKIDDNLYKFKDEIKRSINFQIGDIASTKINQVDVISCRNVLIYFTEETKEQLFEKFYNSLKDDGFLILGMAEDIPRSMRKYFVPIESKEKIFQKCKCEKNL